MPPDLAPIDLVAVTFFVAVWLAYNLIFDHLLRRPAGLNRHMRAVRAEWMGRMIERDNRITDAALLGHLIHNVSFFVSTTMLVLAGLLGIVGALDDTHRAIIDLGVTVATTQALFELKVLVLLAVFVFAFFKFTWALRQFNYCCGLIGGAPPLSAPEPQREAVAARIADMLSLATNSFNGGLRAYYFALAALSWFIQPWLFIVMTAWVVVVLLRRQLWSRAVGAVRGYVEATGKRRDG
jgi:uncharacterized membrane protein